MRTTCRSITSRRPSVLAKPAASISRRTSPPSSRRPRPATRKRRPLAFTPQSPKRQPAGSWPAARRRQSAVSWPSPHSRAAWRHPDSSEAPIPTRRKARSRQRIRLQGQPPPDCHFPPNCPATPVLPGISSRPRQPLRPARLRPRRLSARPCRPICQPRYLNRIAWHCCSRRLAQWFSRARSRACGPLHLSRRSLTDNIIGPRSRPATKKAGNPSKNTEGLVIALARAAETSATAVSKVFCFFSSEKKALSYLGAVTSGAPPVEPRWRAAATRTS